MAFEKLGEEILYQGRVFDLARVRYRVPGGNEHNYDLVKHHGAVVIVPVDSQGRILFVRQFRIGAGEDLMELPAGLLEEDEHPELSAQRELREEIGMGSETMVKLGEFYMVPGYSTEKLHAYLATGLYESALEQDEDEVLEGVALPIAEVFELIRAGKMTDGKTLASLLLAQPHLTRLAGEKLV